MSYLTADRLFPGLPLDRDAMSTYPECTITPMSCPSVLKIFAQLRRTGSPFISFCRANCFPILNILEVVLHHWEAGGLVVPGRTYQLRIPHLSPGTGWPLFFAATDKWPKITHMLP